MDLGEELLGGISLTLLDEFISNGGTVTLKTSLSDPFIFDSLEGSTVLTSLFSFVHEFGQSTNIRVSGTNDKFVITGINVGAQESGAQRQNERRSSSQRP